MAESNFKSMFRDFANRSGGGGGGGSRSHSYLPVWSGMSSRPGSAGGGADGMDGVTEADSLFGSMRSRASGVLGTITGTAPGTGDVLGLSRVERLVACMVCLGLAAFCFFIAFTLLPFLVLNLRKFAMLYTMGSLLALLGIAVLHGLSAHLAHLCSAERLPFTLCYFGTMGLTLYLSFAHKPHLLIIFASIAQMLCLVWYFVSYLPGGVAGLSWMSRTVSRVALRL